MSVNEYRFVNKENSAVAIQRGIDLQETDTHYIVRFGGASHMKLNKKVWRLSVTTEVKSAN